MALSWIKSVCSRVGARNERKEQVGFFLIFKALKKGLLSLLILGIWPVFCFFFGTSWPPPGLTVSTFSSENSNPLVWIRCSPQWPPTCLVDWPGEPGTWLILLSLFSSPLKLCELLKHRKCMYIVCYCISSTWHLVYLKYVYYICGANSITCRPRLRF